MNSGTFQSPDVTRWLREMASYADYSQFRKLWQHSVTEQMEQGYLAACYEQVAARAIREGEYFLAYDAVTHGLRCGLASAFPSHVLLAHKATALARSGAAGEALRVLDEFLETHEADYAIATARARVCRDHGLAAPTLAKRREWMRQGAAWAAQAKELARLEKKDWAYPANQEAQFHFLAGELELARACAAAVIDFVRSRMDDKAREDLLWEHTNISEMCIIRGELATAAEHYAKAAKYGANAGGDLAACRIIAEILTRELSRYTPVDDGFVNQWFPKQTMLVFAGHLPDAKDRPAPRLPEKLCRANGPAGSAIAALVRKSSAVEGICATAPGGDVLFAEAVLACKKKLTLLEPFPRHRIRQVGLERGYDWLERLDRMFTEATRVESIACAEDANEEAQCEYATFVMLGTALLRAKRVNADLKAILLWDESDANAPKRGGTGDFYNLCAAKGVKTYVINPSQLPV